MIRAVLDWIQANAFLDFVIFFIFTYVLEISKIKIDPWTAAGRAIGKAINHDVIERLDDLDERIDNLEKHRESDKEELEIEKTEERRTRILRAADEIRVDIKHSKEFFDEIMRDVSRYESFCRDHEDYHNNRAVVSIKIITDEYERCMRENSFL